MRGPAIGLIELNSIASGFFTTDAMVKKAQVTILKSSPICAGKFMVLISGYEAEVTEAMKDGREAAQGYIVDEIVIYNLHDFVVPAIIGASEVTGIDSIGILETFSVASAIISADAAAKEADVKLIDLRLANGLGGKSYFTFTGELFDVEAAMKKAKDTVLEMGMYVNDRIIARPHKDMADVIL